MGRPREQDPSPYGGSTGDRTAGVPVAERPVGEGERHAGGLVHVRCRALPDGIILFTGAATKATTAAAVALRAHRTLFLPAQDQISEHAKLADIVHSNLLAFAVFVNSHRREVAVLREASTLSRLDRELELIGGPAANAEPTLSREVTETMTARIGGIRAIVSANGRAALWQRFSTSSTTFARPDWRARPGRCLPPFGG